MPYVEKDVSRDQQAAQEMVRRTGQMGVPVITVDGDVVVGFDQPRLERLIAATRGGTKRLGASVAAKQGRLHVGQVHAGSLAAKAGLQPGDLIVRVDGAPTATPEQLQERVAPALNRSVPVRFDVERNGQDLQLLLAPPFD